MAKSMFVIVLLSTCLSASAGIFTSAGFSADSNFFPIAVWLQSPSNAAAYKATGINLYVGLWEGPTQQQLSDLKTAGMPVICDQNSYALDNLATYGDVIAGWMHGDEPDNAQWNGSGYDPCIAPDTIIGRFARWKARDSARPVYLNLGQGVSYTTWIGRGTCTGRTDMYPGYLQGCDIASYDIYPVNSSYDEVRGNLWYVPKGIDSLCRWSNNAKPVWCWIECTRIDSSSSVVPTPAQMKSEVWMALIHGARGFGYFCHSWYGTFREAAWLQDAAMRTAITAINRRIDTLAPVLNSTATEPDVTVTSSNPSVPVDIMAKNHGGSLYIFAAAMRNDTTTARFGISSLLGATGVTVLDEGRTIGISIGSATDWFGDRFDGYGVHLYKISTVASIKRHRPARGFGVKTGALERRTDHCYSLSGARIRPGMKRGVVIEVRNNRVIEKRIFLP
ncbi:MAG: hypothetical protein JW768_01360 [Chitinispirillaceae bacterium]|nr:hypothetical protein [Chitinispirillaceae bacterium]